MLITKQYNMEKLGIKITQEIKDKNQHNWVQDSTLGDIIIKRVENLPNRFHVTKNIAYGYKNNNKADLREADGWKTYVIPSFDVTNQELGTLIETETTFTHEIINLTQEQIDGLVEVTNSNISREAVSSYIENGFKEIEKVKAKLYRRATDFKNGNFGLTKPQVGKLERWFAPTYSCLVVGDFRNAKREIQIVLDDRGVEGNSTLLETAGMEDTAIWFKDRIVDFFDNEYDL